MRRRPAAGRRRVHHLRSAVESWATPHTYRRDRLGETRVAGTAPSSCRASACACTRRWDGRLRPGSRSTNPSGGTRFLVGDELLETLPCAAMTVSWPGEKIRFGRVTEPIRRGGKVRKQSTPARPRRRTVRHRPLKSLIQRFESARRLEPCIHARFSVPPVCRFPGSDHSDCSSMASEARRRYSVRAFDRGRRPRPRRVRTDLGHTSRRVPEQFLHGVQVALGRVETWSRMCVASCGASGEGPGRFLDSPPPIRQTSGRVPPRVVMTSGGGSGHGAAATT